MTLAECVPIIGVARQRLGVKHELAASAGVGGDDAGFDADLSTTPALQEESTKRCSGLRQSIPLQFEAVAPSHHGYPPTSVLNSSPASRRAMASNQASEVSVEPFLHSSFPSRKPRRGYCGLPIGSWIFLPGRIVCLKRCGPRNWRRSHGPLRACSRRCARFLRLGQQPEHSSGAAWTLLPTRLRSRAWARFGASEVRPWPPE